MFWSTDITDCSFVVESLHFTKKGNSFLVLSDNRKNIFELKEIAAEIWSLIQKPISFKDLFKKIKKNYKVSDEELKKDLISWLNEAMSEKLIKKIKN